MSCPRQDLIHVFHIPQASKTHSSKGMKSWRGSVLVGVVSHQLSAPTAQLMCVTALGWFGLGRREGGMNKEKSHMQGYIFLKNSFLYLLPSKQSKSDRKTTLWDRNKQKKNHLNPGSQFPGTEQTTRKCSFQCQCSASHSSFPCLSKSWSHHRAQPSPTYTRRPGRGRGGKLPINHTWDLLLQPDSWSCFRKL